MTDRAAASFGIAILAPRNRQRNAGGIVCCLPKPFGREQFARILGRRLRGRPPDAPAAATCPQEMMLAVNRGALQAIRKLDRTGCTTWRPGSSATTSATRRRASNESTTRYARATP